MGTNFVLRAIANSNQSGGQNFLVHSQTNQSKIEFYA
jgi:hypothetical protein